jgi:hypothetical protein
VQQRAKRRRVVAERAQDVLLDVPHCLLSLGQQRPPLVSGDDKPTAPVAGVRAPLDQTNLFEVVD